MDIVNKGYAITLIILFLLSGKIMAADRLIPEKVYLHDPDFLSSLSIAMPNTADEFYHLIKLADKGNSDANWMLAIIYEQSHQYQEAKKYYHRSIETKDKYINRSAINLGYLYDKENNITQAMALFQLAGENGYSEGFKALATEYFLGHSVPLDIEKAKIYYRKAAKLGCHQCQYYLDNWDSIIKLRLKDR